MNRTELTVPDEEIAEEFGRVVALLQRATRKPLFRPLMTEAKRKGLNWIEALEYVVDRVPEAPGCGQDLKRAKG